MESKQLSLLQIQIKMKEKRFEIKNFIVKKKEDNKEEEEDHSVTLKQLRDELNNLIRQKDSLLANQSKQSKHNDCDCCVDYGSIAFLSFDKSDTNESIPPIYCFEKKV